MTLTNGTIKATNDALAGHKRAKKVLSSTNSCHPSTYAKLIRTGEYCESL